MGFYIIYTPGSKLPPDNPITPEYDPIYVREIHNIGTIITNEAVVWYGKLENKNID